MNQTKDQDQEVAITETDVNFFNFSIIYGSVNIVPEISDEFSLTPATMSGVIFFY
jgi:hypothetical protein